MSDQAEIITLGLGNYGVLTAAHWCNATSKYDQEHNVLYMESLQSSSGGAPIRVPRLLLLDVAQPSQQVAEFSLCDDAPPDDFGALSPDVVAKQMEANAEPETEEDLFRHTAVFEPWEKYIAVPLHPKTMVSIDALHRHPSSWAGLKSFGFGMNSFFMEHACVPHFLDNLRWMLERCDQCQGLQVFVDADSAFGGLLHSMRGRVREEHGDLPIACAAAFPATSDACSAVNEEKNNNIVSTIGLAGMGQEIPHLNRLLATQCLSQCELYLPFEAPSWQGRCVEGALSNDVLTSAIIAAVADTALFCSRQEGQSRRLISALAAMLRPEPRMRMCSIFSTVTNPGPWIDFESEAAPSLWDVLESLPLLDPASFRSLTAPLSTTVPRELVVGSVLSHSVALRGFGKLQDVKYPREEALVRYIAPLQTSNYSTLLTDEGYPISGSFPARLLPIAALVDPTQPQVAQDPSVTAPSVSLSKTLPLATHIVNGRVCGPYIRAIVQNAEPIVKYSFAAFGGAYELERDEWREVLEGAHALRDDYDYDEPPDD